MKTIGAILDKVLELFLAVMGALVFLSAIAQVLFRYAVGDSLLWSEELGRYLFVWLVFLGAAHAVSTKGHLVINMITQYLPDMGQRAVELIAQVLMMVFFVFLAVQGFRLSATAWNQLSPAVEIPMGVVYLVIPISALLMLFNSIRVLLAASVKQRRRA